MDELQHSTMALIVTWPEKNSRMRNRGLPVRDITSKSARFVDEVTFIVPQYFHWQILRGWFAARHNDDSPVSVTIREGKRNGERGRADVGREESSEERRGMCCGQCQWPCFLRPTFSPVICTSENMTCALTHIHTHAQTNTYIVIGTYIMYMYRKKEREIARRPIVTLLKRTCTLWLISYMDIDM